MAAHRTVAEPHRGVSDRSGWCRRYRWGFLVLGAGTTLGPWSRSPPIPGSGGGDGEHRINALLMTAGRRCVGRGSISGLHVYQILAHAPAIDDFISKTGRDRRPGEGLMPRRRRYCRSPLVDNPPTWTHTWISNAPNGPCACLPGRMGCGRSPGCLTRSTRAILAETLARSPAPGHPRHHHPGPTPR